jgi:hypothetical protein
MSERSRVWICQAVIDRCRKTAVNARVLSLTCILGVVIVFWSCLLGMSRRGGEATGEGWSDVMDSRDATRWKVYHSRWSIFSFILLYHDRLKMGINAVLESWMRQTSRSAPIKSNSGEKHKADRVFEIAITNQLLGNSTSSRPTFPS